MKNELYTWVGASHSVLVSVNPYARLPLYGDEQIDEHRNKTPNKVVPPHVFDIANDSYDSMLFDSVDQSVLISGESGAGKTEATKQCLKVHRQSRGLREQHGDQDPAGQPRARGLWQRQDDPEQQLVPRFGKWIEVYFEQGKRSITSAKIINYLLEKSRLVHQQSAERNFHIFYQMATASETANKYEIGTPHDYRYLNQGHCEKIEGIDDAEDFTSTKQAMKDLEFSDEEIEWVLQLTAFILHLGNCTFLPKDLKDNVKGSSVENDEPLGKAAKFLDVPIDELRKVLLNRSITVRNETHTIPLDEQAARGGCDSLAKGVYGKLFDWLVHRINDALRGTEGSFIGILDIFGFEIFDNNSFEQLCINYANEKLQQLFNKSTFKEEEASVPRAGHRVHQGRVH